LKTPRYRRFFGNGRASGLSNGLRQPAEAVYGDQAGDLPGADFEAFYADASMRWPWVGPAGLTRLTRAYGTRLERVLGDARAWGDLGEDYGATLTEAEIAYLKREEWAKCADDVLWRRSKLGLHMTPAQRERLATAF
jgi:glycerol-3-phosphate dehydrogenase